MGLVLEPPRTPQAFPHLPTPEPRWSSCPGDFFTPYGSPRCPLTRGSSRVIRRDGAPKSTSARTPMGHDSSWAPAQGARGGSGAETLLPQPPDSTGSALRRKRRSPGRKQRQEGLSWGCGGSVARDASVSACWAPRLGCVSVCVYRACVCEFACVPACLTCECVGVCTQVCVLSQVSLYVWPCGVYVWRALHAFAHTCLCEPVQGWASRRLSQAERARSGGG